MTTIRVHLGPMPEMLRTIIGDLLGNETDLVVVGSSAPGEDALRQAQKDDADVLITDYRGRQASSLLDGLLSATPISVLAISNDGQSADAVCLIRRHPVSLGQGGQSRLADTVREIVGQINKRDDGLVRLRPA